MTAAQIVEEYVKQSSQSTSILEFVDDKAKQRYVVAIYTAAAQWLIDRHYNQHTVLPDGMVRIFIKEMSNARTKWFAAEIMR